MSIGEALQRAHEELATELRKHQGFLGPRDTDQPDVWFRWCVCGWDGGPLAPEDLSQSSHSYREHLADALIPIVGRIAREQAGEEREKTRAPFLALADEMEHRDAPICRGLALQAKDDLDPASEAAYAMQAYELRMCAYRIREAGGIKKS